MQLGDGQMIAENNPSQIQFLALLPAWLAVNDSPLAGGHAFDDLPEPRSRKTTLQKSILTDFDAI
jgi:hypothetical protein